MSGTHRLRNLSLEKVDLMLNRVIGEEGQAQRGRAAPPRSALGDIKEPLDQIL